MSKAIQKQMKSIEKLRLPELQARFAEVVGDTTRSPNRKFLLRRIEEALAARANAQPARSEDAPLRASRRNASGSASEPERTPTTETATVPDGAPQKPRGRFASMSIEELQTKYCDVVGRSTGSDDRRYVEPGDMWSWASARRVLPRRARETTPHNRAAFSGGMTLRFPRPEACMATGAVSWRSQGERA